MEGKAILFVLVTLATIATFFSAGAEDCSAIKADPDRLKCYDAIAARSSTPAGAPIDLVDLILDMEKLKGQQVVVTGTGTMFMGSLMLSKIGASSESIYVSIDKVDRGSQKAVIENCGSRFCDVVVSGAVKEVTHNKVFQTLGVEAQRISIAQ